MTEIAPSTQRFQPLRHWLARAVLAPPYIYGTIIVSAVVIVADEFESDLELFEVTLGTTLVVWIGHVFSDTVARGFDVQPLPTPLRTLLHHALVDSIGILLAGIPPLILLLLGALGVLDEYFSYYLALAVPTVLLGVVGWLLFARRGGAWPIRLLGAVATAGLGAFVIVLKSLVH